MPDLSIGPPPAGPPVCFPCVTGRCGHSPAVLASSVHGGGLVPALTCFQGTALCLDCATREAAYLPDPDPPR